MNKINILQAIIATLEVQYQTAIEAAKEAHRTATDDETIAENKYDTFALEASYLAHGQSQRVLDCENNLRSFKALTTKIFTTDAAIAVGAAVTLSQIEELTSNTASIAPPSAPQKIEHTKYYFIGPSCGGLEITLTGKRYMVISPQSALGQILIGKYLEDEVTIPVAGQLVDYTITQVF